MNREENSMTDLNSMTEVQDLIDRGALFVVNHSGGKDSQAMMIKVREIVPADQIMVIHADLSDVEFKGTKEHAKKSAGDFPFIVCKNNNKTFFEMVRHRKAFPSPKYRQCTSDLKRGPINREIRGYMVKHGFKLAVSCMGLRAEESSARQKQNPWKVNTYVTMFEKMDHPTRKQKNGRPERVDNHDRPRPDERMVWDWLPIHEMKIGEVFETIKAAGEEPHWAYAAGMSRLSCCFCIMGSKKDLQTAARLVPDMYAAYVALEKEVNHTMNMTGKGLEEVTGIKVKFNG